MLKKIKENEFENEVLKNNKPVIVDFFATWCGPCQMLMPVLKEISEERQDIDIIEIDVDESRNLAYKYEIEAVPTMIIFKNGNAIDRIGGFYPKAELEEVLKRYL